MSIKKYFNFISGRKMDGYDRLAEERLLKPIKIYNKGGKWNRARAIRMYNRNRTRYNCSIPPSIVIGKNFYIAHAHGVSIGKTTVIGDNCRIYPNTEIVASIIGDSELRKNGEKRWHPKIGDNCLIGAGSIICGRIEIGDNVIIAAGAIVTKDVPSNSIVKNTNEIIPRRDD